MSMSESEPRSAAPAFS